MIKSFPELNTNEVFILIQENPFSDVFYQVKLTDEQFEKVTQIINEAKEGFTVTAYPDKYCVVDYHDLEDD